MGVGEPVISGLVVGVGKRVGAAVGAGEGADVVKFCGIWLSSKNILCWILSITDESRFGERGSVISCGTGSAGFVVKALKISKKTQKTIVIVVKTTIETRLGIFGGFISFITYLLISAKIRSSPANCKD